MIVLTILRTHAKMALGKLLNLASFPGFIRPCDYKAGITAANISVRVHDLFTVVTVNGLDIYFTRLTGKIDGVGFSPAADYTSGSGTQSIDSGAPLAPPHQPPVQTGKASARDA